MRKMKLFGIITGLCALALFGGPSCGSSGGTGPTQQELDQLFADLTTAVDGIQGGQCFSNCADLEGDAAFSGTFDCSGGGTFTLTAGTCDASGTITYTITADNCSDGQGNTVNGSVTLTLTVSATETTLTISSSGVSTGDFDFSTSNLSVTIPCNAGVAGEPTCSGNVSAGGETCSLASDCSTCTL